MAISPYPKAASIMITATPQSRPRKEPITPSHNAKPRRRRTLAPRARTHHPTLSKHYAISWPADGKMAISRDRPSPDTMSPREVMPNQMNYDGPDAHPPWLPGDQALRSPPHSKPHNPQRGAKTKRPPLDLPVPAPDGPQEIEATGVP